MSYWDALHEATDALARRDPRGAERSFLEARGLRERSPGRVFLSETLSDAARKLWRGRGGGESGRWERAAGEFTAAFAGLARSLLAEHPDPRTADAAGSGRRDRDGLAGVVFLLLGSELHASDPERGGASLLVLLRECVAAGTSPEPSLLPAPGLLPPTVLPSFATLAAEVSERVVVDDGGAWRDTWTRAAVAVIEAPGAAVAPDPECRLRLGRARLLDRLGDAPAAAVEAYRDYLVAGPPPGPERERVQLRVVRLLANVETAGSSVPRYRDALEVLGLFDPDDPARHAEHAALAAVVDERRLHGREGVWATLAPDDAGWTAVLWHDGRPRDAALWREGDGHEVLASFLAVAADRVLAASAPCPWTRFTLPDLLEALEQEEVAGGLSRDGLGGLEPDRGVEGHPYLDHGRGPAADACLRLGDTWRETTERLAVADPAWRSGLRRMARTGDAGAGFVASFLPPELVPGEGWPLVPLDERPDPELPRGVADVMAPGAPTEGVGASVVDEDRAVVISGRPASVLADWGGGRARWRIVLDRLSRLGELAPTLRVRGGGFTLLPTHGPDEPLAALRDLEDLLSAPRHEGPPDLLPLLHWTRICATHNGDLADFAALDPRRRAVGGLHDRYVSWLAERRDVERAGAWHDELAARVARSEIVAGVDDDLEGARPELARRWGLGDERPGAWVFCDSAVIHWRRARLDADGPAGLHRRLLPLVAAHLSIVGDAPLLRRDLLDVLAGWIGRDVGRHVFRDRRTGILELAGSGVVPDALVAVGALIDGVVATLERLGAGGANPLLVTRPGPPLHEMVSALSRGEFAADGPRPWHVTTDVAWDAPDAAAARTVVLTELESLRREGDGDQTLDEASAWHARDERRRLAATGRRRLCALEIAAWRGAEPASLTVLDPRWRRMLQDAAADAEVDGAVIVDLPTTPDLRGSAHRWLRGQGWVEADGEGLPPAPPRPLEESPHLAPGSPALVLGAADGAWYDTLRDAWRRYETGATSDWLLVVTEEPPPGAGRLADADSGPGASTTSALGDEPPGPLCWVRPAELVDDALRRRLRDAAPGLVWAADLGSWLPSEHTTGMEYAGAVRFLLRDLAATPRIHAATLPAVWRDVWPELTAAAGRAPIPVVGGGDATPRPGDGPSLPVLRFGRMEEPCPSCGVIVELRDGRDACPTCGLDVLRWLPRRRRRELTTRIRMAKLRDLDAREAEAHEQPLCVWVPAREVEAWTDAVEYLGRAWRRAASRGLDRSDDVWHICLLGDQQAVPAECRHAVMVAPQDDSELDGLRRIADGELGLWYHPLEAALREGRPGVHAVDAPPEPFRRHPLASPEGLDEALAWRGLATRDVQESVAGAAATRVRRFAGAAAWIDAVTGEAATLPRRPDERTLRWRISRVEFEYRIESALRTLSSLLPAWLAGLPDGTLRACDLREPPLEIEGHDLAWCDRLLLALSLALDGTDVPGAPQLLYVADAGLAASTRRTVGVLGGGADAIDAVLSTARRLAEDVGRVYDRDETEGDGLRAESTDLDPDLITAGVLLGCWMLEGVPMTGEVPVPADATASVETVARAAVLLTAQDRDRTSWNRKLAESWRIGFHEDLPGEAEPETVVVGGEGATGAFASRLGSFLDVVGPGQRLLEGPRGSERSEMIADALAGLDDPGRARSTLVLAPDLGAAARFHAAWRCRRPGEPPPRIVAPAGDLAADPTPDPVHLATHDDGGPLVVLGLEDQPSALRYRLAPEHRGGPLLAVLDPHLHDGSREHLLLRQPEAAEIVTVKRPVAVAREIRDELADWVEAAEGSSQFGKATSRERGEVWAAPVANRDNALALIHERCAEEALTSPVDVIAPTLDDLDYLGRGAARLGWLPVYRWELDALLLPGAVEFMAAVCDAAALTGDDEEPVADRLASLLPAHARDEARAWLAARDPETPLITFCRDLFRAGWCADVFADPVVAERAVRLARAVPDETAARFAARPTAEVWRSAVAGWPGMPMATPSGPVLCLATPDRAGGGEAGTVVHLCAGTEEPRLHYRVASRARQRLLLLYRTRSPRVVDQAGY